jgi:hypothetical protein
MIGEASNSPIMTNFSLTRRQLVQVALTGAATTLIPASAEAQNFANSAPASANSTSEGAALAGVIPFNVGYAQTPTQATEAAAALKECEAAFSKARAYALPDDVAPAWVAALPPPRNGKGRG